MELLDVVLFLAGVAILLALAVYGMEREEN